MLTFFFLLFSLQPCHYNSLCILYFKQSLFNKCFLFFIEVNINLLYYKCLIQFTFFFLQLKDLIIKFSSSHRSLIDRF